MHTMNDQQRVNAVRALSVEIDKLSRSSKRFTPSAPWIIPALMIFVVLFAFVCFVVKLLMNYLTSKDDESPKKYGFTDTSSPDITATPEDQTSMATTASMRTRDSLRNNSNRGRRNRLPPVSLYQLKQKQSSSASVSSTTKLKTNRAANKAVSRMAKQAANRSLMRNGEPNQDSRSDNDNDIDDGGDNSPTNLSQHSGDTETVQGTAPNVAYGATIAHRHDEALHQGPPDQPEVHVVQIRDLEENVQHSQPVWPQTESEI